MEDFTMPANPVRLSLLAAALTVAASTATAQPNPQPQGAIARNALANASLWLAEVIEDGKPIRPAARICADPPLVRAFARPMPVINGRDCPQLGQILERGATYSARCKLDGQIYHVGATIAGDRARDFTVDIAVRRLVKTGPVLEQTRHYRKLDACPSGWAIGTSAPEK
jgi:hypothetical protein